MPSETAHELRSLHRTGYEPGRFRCRPKRRRPRLWRSGEWMAAQSCLRVRSAAMQTLEKPCRQWRQLKRHKRWQRSTRYVLCARYLDPDYIALGAYAGLSGSDHHMAEMSALTVWFDGNCPLCRREIALMRRMDRRARIDFLDAAQPTQACPVERADLLARFHAREDGAMLTGACLLYTSPSPRDS